MNIVIIGSGWLGKPLAISFSESGHAVTSVFRSNKPHFENESIYAVALNDSGLNEKLIAADLVVFCFPAPRDGGSHAQTCLELVAECSPNCRFIFTSTTGVYPEQNEAFNENSELDASNKHVCTELELRNVLQDKLTTIRLAGLVGEGRYPVRMMSLSGKTYNGDQYCNLIHLDDAIGIIQFLVEKGISVPVVNACAPIHPAKGEYYSAMAEKLGINAPVFEKGPTGKLIQSDLSISLGYQYLRPNPYDFF